MMKKLGISSIYVVNKKRELLGAITADDARAAAEKMKASKTFYKKM